jgi:predicted phage terminase large subunit-like protein
VAETAKKYTLDTLLIENKAAGHSVAQELRRLFSYEDWGIIMDDPKGQDKLARVYSIQHLFFEEMVYIPDQYSWAQMIITECEQFPNGKNDDLVDTVSGALRYLRKIGVMVRGAERTAETAESMKFSGNTNNKPLYPV